jgi:hypothetical protein
VEEEVCCTIPCQSSVWFKIIAVSWMGMEWKGRNGRKLEGVLCDFHHLFFSFLVFLMFDFWLVYILYYKSFPPPHTPTCQKQNWRQRKLKVPCAVPKLIILQFSSIHSGLQRCDLWD